MTQREKLILGLNKPVEIELMFDEGVTGSNRFGDYILMAVKSAGHEYSYFPVPEVYEKLKRLRKGDKAIITKTAAQKGTKLVTSFLVSIPDSKRPATEVQSPAEDKSTTYPPELNVVCSDRYYDTMMQSYRDAMKLNTEFGGMIDPTRIAITLFIARSNCRSGG